MKWETDCENIASPEDKLAAGLRLYKRVTANGKSNLANGIILFEMEGTSQFQAHDMGRAGPTEWSEYFRNKA